MSVSAVPHAGFDRACCSGHVCHSGSGKSGSIVPPAPVVAPPPLPPVVAVVVVVAVWPPTPPPPSPSSRALSRPLPSSVHPVAAHNAHSPTHGQRPTHRQLMRSSPRGPVLSHQSFDRLAGLIPEKKA